MKFVIPFLLVVCIFLLVESNAYAPELRIGSAIIQRKDIELEAELKAQALEKEKASPKTARSCVSNCYNHGTCNGGECSCYVGWTGSDCSVADIELRANVAVHGTVGNHLWTYYHISVQDPRNGLRFWVNQTSNTGDADVYARKGAFPTRTVYAVRDVTLDQDVSLVINDPGVGTWYLGVYGYQAVDFDVIALTEGACPNDCSERGRCIGGECYCNNGWTTADCSVAVTVLQNDVQIRAHVEDQEWVYYSYTSDHDNFMRFVVSQQGDGDVDAYLAYGRQPTALDYDYRDLSLSPHFELDVLNPAVGEWILGLYGFAATDFTLKVTQTANCLNQCSGATHGHCNGASCVCMSTFNGEYCENMKPSLSINGPAVDGLVTKGAWNYFHVDTFTSSNVLIHMQETNDDGDCDLYIRNGEKPTWLDYDYSDISTNPSVDLTIEAPGSRTWYIGVYGYDDCTFTISAAITQACPNACSNHGSCNANGHCVCHNGYGGDDCSAPVLPLPENSVNTGSYTIGQWVYYEYAWQSDVLSVVVKETQTAGFVSVYASYESFPDTRFYVAADTSDNSVHRLNQIRPSHPDGSPLDSVTVYIGVLINHNAPPTQPVEYKIAAWDPFHQ